MIYQFVCGLLLILAITLTGCCGKYTPGNPNRDDIPEGIGLFSGEKGYFDITQMSGINQERKPCEENK